MACLTDIELQALADGERGAGRQSHLETCAACRTKLDDRRRLMARLAQLAASDVVPTALTSRMREAVRSSPPARGATVLHPARALPRRPLWLTALATAAAIAIVAFVVMPRVDSPTTLSAAQIIDRSLAQMTTGHGMELLEYELRLESSYRRQAGLSEGPFRIIQIFDRNNPARFRIQQLDANGELISVTAQDPAAKTRTEMMRVDGRNYIVRLTSLPGPMVSIPELLQSQAASILRMMQINADEHLTVEDGPDGKRFIIEMPAAERAQQAGPLSLERARVVIDGTDYRVQTADVAGTLLGHRFDVTFNLITQIKAADIQPEEWGVTPGPGDVVIEGDGQGEPFDSMTLILRELGRSR